MRKIQEVLDRISSKASVRVFDSTRERRPRPEDNRPSARRVATAWRTGPREVLNCSHSSTSLGSDSPAGMWPAKISSRR